MVFDTTVSINAQGVAGLRVACPYPNRENITDGEGYNYQITAASTTAANIDWGDGTAATGGLAFPSNETTVNNARACRVVSACVIAIPHTPTK